MRKIRFIQDKALKKRRKRKAYIKSRNNKRNKKSFKSKRFKYTKSSHKISIFPKPPKIIIKLKVPEDFSLLTNLEDVLAFFNDCKKYNSSLCDVVSFDFVDVKHIGSGAITILLSICGWLSDQNVSIEGTYPSCSEARARFEKLGFLKYFRVKSEAKLNSRSRSEIVQRGINTTNASLTAEKIRAAMETVIGVSSKNTKIQGMLIELMANTVNHAYDKYQKGWYLSLDHDEEKNKVHFCFVDNGEGILNTIRIKSYEKVKRFLKIKNDGDILQMAFEGEFGSRTKLLYRGRGLPLIKKNFDEGYIKNLIVISNGVYYNFENGTFKILNNEFKGTFYFWELNKECKFIKYGN